MEKTHSVFIIREFLHIRSKQIDPRRTSTDVELFQKRRNQLLQSGVMLEPPNNARQNPTIRQRIFCLIEICASVANQ